MAIEIILEQQVRKTFPKKGAYELNSEKKKESLTIWGDDWEGGVKQERGHSRWREQNVQRPNDRKKSSKFRCLYGWSIKNSERKVWDEAGENRWKRACRPN